MTPYYPTKGIVMSLKPSRSFVKFVANSMYFSACRAVAHSAIEQVVEPETDNEQMLVDASGFAVGTIVWWNTSSKVVGLIDKVADHRIAKKAEKEQTDALRQEEVA